MKRKVVTLILTGLTVGVLLCACGKKEVEVTEEVEMSVVSVGEETTEKTTVETEEVEEPKPVEEEAAEEIDPSEWKNAYLEQLRAIEDDDWKGDRAEYGLIYIDDDEIPELISWKSDAAYVSTYNQNGKKIETVGLEQDCLKIAYQENKVRFQSIENMELDIKYYDTFYSIQNGKWDRLGEGEYATANEGLDEICKLDGEEISRNEYDNIFNPDTAVTWENNGYLYSDIVAMLDESTDKGENSYAQLYLEKIAELYEYYAFDGYGYKFALINIDGDNIPELEVVADSGMSVQIYGVYGNRVFDAAYIGFHGQLYFFEKQNMIVTDEWGDILCTRINKGQTETVFTGSDLGFINEYNNGKFKGNNRPYLINGRLVTESEYNQKIQEFESRFTEETYFYDVQCKTYDEIVEELRNLRTESDAGNASGEEWKTTYRDCLYDILAGAELLRDRLEAWTYNGVAYFALQDITGDGIPELCVTTDMNHPYWTVYTANDNKYDYLGNMSFYDSDSKKVYVADDTSYEGYSVYTVDNGKLVFETGMFVADADEPYFRRDANGEIYNISESDMNAFRTRFDAGMEKYGLKGIDFSKENIEKEFGS